MVSQVTFFAKPSPEGLDLLDVVDLEHCGIAWSRLEEKCDQDGPLGVCMDAASGIALLERCHEERRALRWFEVWWGADVDALLGVDLFGELEDVDVFGADCFLRYTRGCKVDKIAVLYQVVFSVQASETYSSRILAPPLSVVSN